MWFDVPMRGQFCQCANYPLNKTGLLQEPLANFPIYSYIHVFAFLINMCRSLDMLGRRLISFVSNNQARFCTHAVYQFPRSFQTCQEVGCSSILVEGGIEFNLPEQNLQSHTGTACYAKYKKIKVLTHEDCTKIGPYIGLLTHNILLHAITCI